MAGLGRGLLLLLAVCCLTWLGVLWWWQRGAAPDLQEADLVTYLVLLPLTVFVLVLALRWAWGSAVERMGAAPPSATASSAAPADIVAVPGDAQERGNTWRLVSASVASPVGEAPQDLLDAAEKGEPLPVPDAELVDAHGLPVLVVRADDSTDGWDAVRQTVEELMASPTGRRVQDAGGPKPGWLRAVCLLRQGLEPTAQWLQDWTQAEAAMLETEADKVGSTDDAPPHWLRVVLGVDAHWTEAEQQLTLELLQRWWAEWIGVHASRWEVAWDVVAGSAETMWLKTDQLVLSADRMGQRSWTWMLATSSAMDQETVDRWIAQDCLMCMPQQPRGRVPSEAAAALLFAPSGWAPAPDTDVDSVWLHRPAVSRRSKPIEAPGKVDHQVLSAVAQQALEVAGLQVSDVALLVSDADRHSNRATELYGVTLERFPDLDPVEDMRLLAAVGGHSACASALLTVAAAMGWVSRQGKPCLLLSQADAHDRMALVMKPDALAA